MTATFRSGGLRGFEALVKSLGGDPLELLRRHRISVRLLRDEEALIPLRPGARLLEEAAASLRCPDFCLRLSHHWDMTILGPLAVAIQHSATVEEALRCASRYLFVHSPVMAMHVLEKSLLQPGLAELRFELLIADSAAMRQFTDGCLAGMHMVAQAIAREHYQLRAVCLPHEPVAPLAAYKRHFGAPVRVAQTHGALLVSPATLKVPLRTVSKTLHRLATDYLDAHFTAPGQTVTARVRQAISFSLGIAPIDKPRVAAMLAMHPRTLQRYLLAEDTSYDAILDQFRREGALRYLRSTQMPLTQIAGLLGLSQQSALARSCKRWFDATPTQIRSGPRS
jgi:AraC-like DNA-binding protein